MLPTPRTSTHKNIFTLRLDQMTASDIIRIVTTVSVMQAICDLLANKFVFSQRPYQLALNHLESAKRKLERVQKEAAAGNGNKMAETTTTRAGGGGDTTAVAANATASNSMSEKQKKKLQFAEDDCKQATANVSKHIMVPQLFINLFFLLLIRIFGTEYYGKPIAILPFEPFSLLRFFTGRGLDLSLSQQHKLLSSTSSSLSSQQQQQHPLLATMAASSRNKVTDVSQACSFLFIYLLVNLSVKYYVHKLFGTEPPPGTEVGIGALTESPEVQNMAKKWSIDHPSEQPSSSSSSGGGGDVTMPTSNSDPTLVKRNKRKVKK